MGKRIKNIPEAISVAFNQKVYEQKRNGQDVITLSLGEAFFDIPQYSFDHLDLEKGYHYTDSQGVPELRVKIANYYNSLFGCSVSADENILVSAGSKIIIYMCLLAAIDPGDEVIIIEPAWLSYEHQIRLAGGDVKFVPIKDSMDNIRSSITDKTRLIILNNPNNPAGKVYSKDQLIGLHKISSQNNILLLVDEAYSDFVEPGQFHSIGSLFPDFENVIAVNSLSKTMGISGWRIGYVLAKPEFIQELLVLNQHLVTCAPSILQLYLAEHFDEIHAATYPQAQKINSKRKKVETLLNKAGIETAEGSSTFYIFLNLETYTDDTYSLAEQLLKNHNIAMVPGSAYGQSTKSYLRMSIGVESIERISIAIDILKNILENGEHNN